MAPEPGPTMRRRCSLLAGIALVQVDPDGSNLVDPHTLRPDTVQSEWQKQDSALPIEQDAATCCLSRNMLLLTDEYVDVDLEQTATALIESSMLLLPLAVHLVPAT